MQKCLTDMPDKERTERKWKATRRYELKNIRAEPELALVGLCEELSSLINEMSAEGATRFELQARNIVDRELNPLNENVFVRVIGTRVAQLPRKIIKETSREYLHSDLVSAPDDTLFQIGKDLAAVINDLANEGASYFEIKLFNIPDEVQNPEGKNAFFKVIGTCKEK